jgi:hypothetical protein
MDQTSATLPSISLGRALWYSPPAVAAALLLVLVAAALIRFEPLRGDHFPVNDGGLFWVMIEDLRANQFRLPAVTSYNGLDIPFAYPPLALYVAAFVATVLRVDSIEVVRLMPPIVATLTTLAVFPLARRLSRDVWVAVFATGAFAVLPRAYIWMVMGGGVTRSLGFLFAILAITQLYDLYDRGGRRPLLLAALCSAGAVLSHMEGGWLVVYSSIAFWANGRRGGGGVRDTFILGGIGLVLTAPWWGTVFAQHGIGTFTAALHSGERFSVGLETLSRFAFSETPGFDVIALFGLAGIFTTVRERHLLLPSWMFLIFMMDPRAGSTYAMVPLAILAGIGFVDLARGTSTLPPNELAAELAARRPRWLTEALAALPPVSAPAAIGVLWLASVIAAPVATREPLHILSPEDREAMTWAREVTPVDARFLVLTPTSGWWSDIQGEWFPALAERRSVATPQGREWVADDTFDEAVQRHVDASWCGWFDTVCMREWVEVNGRDFDFVYVPIGSLAAFQQAAEEKPRTAVPDCCTSSFDALLRSDGFRLRFRNDRVAIFEWVGEETGSRLAF